MRRWIARVGGTARVVNHARRRGDGVNGIIHTDDCAFVPFTIEGRTPLSQDGQRRLLGTLDPVLTSGGTTHTRSYACVHELA